MLDLETGNLILIKVHLIFHFFFFLNQWSPLIAHPLSFSLLGWSHYFTFVVNSVSLLQLFTATPLLCCQKEVIFLVWLLKFWQFFLYLITHWMYIAVKVKIANQIIFILHISSIYRFIFKNSLFFEMCKNNPKRYLHRHQKRGWEYQTPFLFNDHSAYENINFKP